MDEKRSTKEERKQEVILPEEGSGKALQREIDELFGREEDECTGESSASPRS